MPRSLLWLCLVAACGSTRPENRPVPEPAPAAPPSSSEARVDDASVDEAMRDAETGFDLFVEPAAVTGWKLDGELLTSRLPTRVRGLTPGVHTIEIVPPPGYAGQVRTLVVERNKPTKLQVTLDRLAGVAPVAPAGPSEPTLTPVMIQASLRPVRSAIVACGDEVAAVTRGERSYAGKQVKLSVEVAPDGHPAHVTVAATDAPSVAACVVGVVRGVMFPATIAGGRFSQPYVY